MQHSHLQKIKIKNNKELKKSRLAHPNNNHNTLKILVKTKKTTIKLWERKKTCMLDSTANEDLQWPCRRNIISDDIRAKVIGKMDMATTMMTT